MEISLEALKEKLGGNLSQRNVDKFLLESLKRYQRTNTARHEHSKNNTRKENL
jgi:hypothetical protein